MDSSPKVSIIIPCYNQAAYLGEAIESALNQTYPNIEIIIVNDASTDSTAQIISEFQNKYPNIKGIHLEQNAGACKAKNIAAEQANGEYILPLDADDKIMPAYVEKAVKILQNNPKTGIVYCKAKLFGTKNKEWRLPPYNKEKILFGNMIFNTALFRKKDFEQAGKYKDYVKNGYEDWDLWLSIIKNGFDVCQIDEILFYYRQTNQETRTQKAENFKQEIFLEILTHHFPLYLESKEFLSRVFALQTPLQKKKYKKYKKLFVLTLFLALAEFLFFIFLLI